MITIWSQYCFENFFSLIPFKSALQKFVLYCLFQLWLWAYFWEFVCFPPIIGAYFGWILAKTSQKVPNLFLISWYFFFIFWFLHLVNNLQSFLILITKINESLKRFSWSCKICTPHCENIFWTVKKHRLLVSTVIVIVSIYYICCCQWLVSRVSRLYNLTLKA